MSNPNSDDDYSDDGSEDNTRHDCSICKEEFSCGNKDDDGNWVCEDCGGCGSEFCGSDSEDE
jgi:ribosomal protein L37AE/L43A